MSRINRVLGWGGLISLVALSAANIFCTKSAVPSSPVEATAIPKQLGQFQEIYGTNYLVAAVQSIGDGSARYYLADDYTPGVIYNYVYLDRETENFQRLLSHNDYVFVMNQKLVFGKDETSNGIMVGWLYGVVKNDTNVDGKLSRADNFTLAVSEVGGTAYTELIGDVEDFFGFTLRDEATLLLMYRQAGKHYLARVDLTARTVVNTIEMPDLGIDLSQ